MAWAKCDKCGKPVPVTIAACPHCGNPTPVKNKPELKAVLAGLALLLGCSGLCGGCWYLIYGPEDAKYATDIEARIIAERFVKAAMTFPEEASFPGMFSTAHRSEHKDADGAWTIVGEVVGKNAFGVRIRNRYRCRLKLIGDDWLSIQDWQLLELSICK